jgi:hypothetical protein
MKNDPLYFSGPEFEPVNSRSWQLATPSQRQRYYTRLGELIRSQMDEQLRLGRDRFGKRLRPRKRPVLSDGAAGPPLTPHNAASRTRRLLALSATATGVRLYWRAAGRLSWRTVLGYHAEGAGRLPVRDVLGISAPRLARAVASARLWWSNQNPMDRAGGLPGLPRVRPIVPIRPSSPVVPVAARPLVERYPSLLPYVVEPRRRNQPRP